MFTKLLTAGTLGLCLAMSSQAMARPDGDRDRPRFGASQHRDHGKHHDRGQRWNDNRHHRGHWNKHDKHRWEHSHKHGGYQYRKHDRHYYNQWNHRGQAYRWQRGHYVPHQYRHSHYVVHNYHRHGLYRPPSGHHWLHVNNDYLLTAIATGVIAAVVIGGH